MTPAEAHFARILLSFIDGQLDHVDESTRRDVAVAAFRVDYSSAFEAGARALHSVDEWYEVLGLVSFESEPAEPDLFTVVES